MGGLADSATLREKPRFSICTGILQFRASISPLLDAEYATGCIVKGIGNRMRAGGILPLIFFCYVPVVEQKYAALAFLKNHLTSDIIVQEMMAVILVVVLSVP